MRKMFANPAVRLVCWYLVITISGVFAVPYTARAAFIPIAKGYVDRGVENIEQLKKALEEELLSEQLLAIGLSPGEITTRLDALTDDERQGVMADLDMIQAGGDGVGTLVGVALLVLIVVLILKVLDKEIIIK